MTLRPRPADQPVQEKPENVSVAQPAQEPALCAQEEEQAAPQTQQQPAAAVSAEESVQTLEQPAEQAAPRAFAAEAETSLPAAEQPAEQINEEENSSAQLVVAEEHVVQITSEIQTVSLPPRQTSAEPKQSNGPLFDSLPSEENSQAEQK